MNEPQENLTALDMLTLRNAKLTSERDQAIRELARISRENEQRLSRHKNCVENLEGELKRIGKEFNESLYREVQLLAENERLKQIIKEKEEYGCHIADETGHVCSYVTENKRLRETIADFLSDTPWSLISPELLDRARKQALKGGK